MNAPTPEQIAAFCAYISAQAAHATRHIKSAAAQPSLAAERAVETPAQTATAADQTSEDAVNLYGNVMAKRDQLRRYEGGPG
jgi:hypothetical protein